MIHTEPELLHEENKKDQWLQDSPNHLPNRLPTRLLSSTARCYI